MEDVPSAKRPGLTDSPELLRAAPFVLFLLLGSLQGKLFPDSEYWMYLAKTVAAGALLWVWRRRIVEMRWRFSWTGVAVGVGISLIWLAAEGRVPSLEQLWARVRGSEVPAPAGGEWNPVAHFAGNAALGWFFVAVRIVGRSLVVPPLEEVFYRSFLYRFLVSARFEEVALAAWHPVAFVVTSAAFGLSHPGQWLAGILCGMAYQWLVLRHGRLGDAMLAHAVTNLVNSGYAVATGQWQFT